MLEIENLHAGYGAGDVLRNLRMQFPAGRIGCLLGSNGAGKSTTMKALSGLLRPVRGQIRFDGESLTGLAPEQILARGLALVPEGRRVFSPLSVDENLEVGGYRFLRARRSSEYRRQREHVLALFPRLAERSRQLAGTLSGGEQQMLAIGRAMMSAPRFLMLDEPSMGLAPMAVKSIFDALRQLGSEGMTLLIAEQNAGMTLGISHSGYVLQEGAIAQSGSADALMGDPRVRAAYLGV